MPRYLAICSYDGTNFSGYQKQNDARTIQGEIEKVISKLLDKPTIIYASGRTDAGVHALGQTFHFDTEKELDVQKFCYGLNSLLPLEIHIHSIEKKENDFHARFSALAKKYVYKIHQGEANPFLRNTALQMNASLDVQSMKEAASFFIGVHSFLNFTSKEEDEDQFVRTIYEVNIEKKDDFLILTFVGTGFMRYMVRMMVGALIAVGQGKEKPSFIKEMLQKETRNVISYKAPSQGLYLEKVYYPVKYTYNFHTHTSRCGHACGSDEEYVLKAIQAGVKTLGFSDHIFYPHLTHDDFPRVRGDYALLDDYISSILTLKEKYKSQIDIHVGFEAEYYEDYDDYYRELLESKKVEYLILGQHFLRPHGVTMCFCNGPYDQKGILAYKDALIQGMKTGYYRYVAHPDLYLCFYAPFDDVAKKIACEICEASLRYDMPLEINLGGMRRGLKEMKNGDIRFPYPHPEFWKIVAEYHCKVIIGVDAHDPDNFLSPIYFYAKKMIEDLHLDEVTLSL